MPRPRNRAPARYYALVVPGLERIASVELEAAGATVLETLSRFDRRDSIIVFAAGDPGRALRCGTLEDVCRLLVDAPVPPGVGAPRALARRLDAPVFSPAALEHHALRPHRHGRSYKVVTRLAGRQAFRREDLSAALARALGRLLPRWSHVSGAAALELWVHVVGDRMLAGLRLSGDELAARAYKRAHLPASLKPSVARALAILSGPGPGDVVLDPMCGAGTILRERAAAARSRRILGGDNDAVAIAASRRNAGRQPALALWDAGHLPLRAASVDAVVTNPPYGRQLPAAAGLQRLYGGFMGECARVLRPGGRCVVLTGEPEVLTRAAPAALRMRERHSLVLRGLSVVAFVFDRV